MATMLPLNLLYRPKQQWQLLSDAPTERYNRFLFYPVFMALLPAIAWYVGLTEIGWRVGEGETVRLTRDSAVRIIILFYLAILTGIAIVGYLVHWMSNTYGCDTTVGKGIAITGLTATPLFIFGLLGFYPIFGLALLVGLLALSWTVYLLYTGIPIVMKIPAEQGFLYASAIVAVGMVMFMTLMGASVVLWSIGAAPVFMD